MVVILCLLYKQLAYIRVQRNKSIPSRGLRSGCMSVLEQLAVDFVQEAGRKGGRLDVLRLDYFKSHQVSRMTEPVFAVGCPGCPLLLAHIMIGWSPLLRSDPGHAKAASSYYGKLWSLSGSKVSARCLIKLPLTS